MLLSIYKICTAIDSSCGPNIVNMIFLKGSTKLGFWVHAFFILIAFLMILYFALNESKSSNIYYKVKAFQTV